MKKKFNVEGFEPSCLVRLIIVDMCYHLHYTLRFTINLFLTFILMTTINTRQKKMKKKTCHSEKDLNLHVLSSSWTRVNQLHYR